MARESWPHEAHARARAVAHPAKKASVGEGRVRSWSLLTTPPRHSPPHPCDQSADGLDRRRRARKRPGRTRPIAAMRSLAQGGAMVGILLLTLGALNSALAMTVETCTQGSAGSLSGGWLTLFLYVSGAAALNAAPPSRAAFLALLPAAAIACWHTWFALTFTIGFWFRGMSACYALYGGFEPEDAGEWMDGGEPLLSILWCVLALIFWSGVIAAFRNSDPLE